MPTPEEQSHKSSRKTHVGEVLEAINAASAEAEVSSVGADDDGRASDRLQVPAAADLITIWAAAKRQVGAQVQALQTACAQFDDEVLQQVAEADLLSGIDAPAQDLEWALMSGADIPAAMAAMRRAIKDDSGIEALDANPMGVPVTIAKTLLDALQQMATSGRGA